MTKLLTVGVVIVSYGHEKEVVRILERLSKQRRAGDRIVIVDNHPNYKAAIAARAFSDVDVIEADNKGFSSGCNLGASTFVDEVDILFFLNPDTFPAETILQVVRSADLNLYDAYMPLLTLPDGKVNSAGNVVHLSGLSWCDGYLDPVDVYKKNIDITVLSGACAAVSVEWWKKVGGMSEVYFLYYEDTDLSTRILLAGGRLGLLVGSYVTHDYDFKKGAHKWFYLERNRPLYILRTWPLAVILLLLPLLLVVEIGLWIVAILDKRFLSKLRALLSFLRVLPRALEDRHEIQKTRSISAYDFIQTVTSDLDTPVLGSIGKNVLIRNVLRIYKKICLMITSIVK